MRACMPCSGSVHVHIARTNARYSRCNVHRTARCSVYRSQRAAQGYHYGGSRHSLLIAGFQRESRPNERSQLRSLAIIIFSATRKDAHTSERAQKYAHTRPNVEYRASFQMENVSEYGWIRSPSSRISSCVFKYTSSIDSILCNRYFDESQPRWNWIKQAARKTGLGGGTRIWAWLRKIDLFFASRGWLVLWQAPVGTMILRSEILRGRLAIQSPRS